MKAYNLRDAIFEALLHRFSIDPTLIAFGEENLDWDESVLGRVGQARAAAGIDSLDQAQPSTAARY